MKAKIGEQKSNNIFDIYSENPKKDILVYLKKLYPQKQDFIYDNFRRTLKQYKTHVNPTPVQTKVTNIKKTFDFEEDGIFDLQCEPSLIIVHIVHIPYTIFKASINTLKPECKAILLYNINPNSSLPQELQKFSKKIRMLEQNRNKFYRTRSKSLDSLMINLANNAS